MRCPKCRTENPARAIRCKCGYDFPSGLLTGSYIAGPEAFLGEAEGIARTYDTVIVAHRLGATLLDGILSVTVAAPLTVLLDSRIIGFSVAVVTQLLYFLLLESRWGLTLGKLALGIRVVDSNGGVPGFQRALVRTLLRLVEVNPIVAGCIPAGVIALSSRTRQRFGDMLAGTYVLFAQDVHRLRER